VSVNIGHQQKKSGAVGKGEERGGRREGVTLRSPHLSNNNLIRGIDVDGRLK